MIDLLIAGLRRSGTTLLCRLLNCPPQQVALIEPNLLMHRRFRQYRGCLRQAKTCVTKEVVPGRIQQHLHARHARQAVIVIRDVRHVGMSIHQWYTDFGRDDVTVRVALDRAIGNAEFLAELAVMAPEIPVLRYEDVVRNSDAIPMFANQFNLIVNRIPEPSLVGRQFEDALHGSRVTPLSIHRRQQETSTERLKAGQYVADRVPTFDRVFGAMFDGEFPQAVGHRNDESVRTEWLETLFRRGWTGGGPETSCGRGSMWSAVEQLVGPFTDLLHRLDIRQLNDAGCGDLNWIRKVTLPEQTRYRGFDIRAWDSWAELPWQCQTLNYVMTVLPPSDLVLCRDSLIHLPNWAISRALTNFQTSTRYLLATSYDCADNDQRWIFRRQFAPVNLSIAPFSLGTPLLRLDEKVPGKYLGLWRLS